MRYRKNIRIYQKGNASWLLMLFATSLLIVIIIMSNFVYRIAYRKGYYDSNKETKILTDGIEMNTEGVKGIQLENKALKDELDTAKQERDISLNNVVELRTRIKDLTTSNAQLKQTIKVYSNNIMSRGGIPLQIIGAKIEPLPENAYEYRFDVLQLTTDGKTNTLRPTIELLTDTSFVDIPTEPNSYKISGVSRVRGRFSMPKGFTPSQLKLTLNSGGEDLEQLYNWKFGKRKDNLPLSLAEVPETDQDPIDDSEKAK